MISKNNNFIKKYILNIVENAIALLVSFSMIIYGVAKIVQFKGSYLASSNKVVSELTGQELMWVFYDYSYKFALLIGVLELIGAILILYKKTRIIGCLFTSFILCNIIIQDYIFGVIALKTAVFYQILILIIMWINRIYIKEVFKSLLIKTKFRFTKITIMTYLLSIVLFLLIKFLEVSLL